MCQLAQQKSLVQLSNSKSGKIDYRTPTSESNCAIDSEN